MKLQSISYPVTFNNEVDTIIDLIEEWLSDHKVFPSTMSLTIGVDYSALACLQVCNKYNSLGWDRVTFNKVGNVIRFTFCIENNFVETVSPEY